MTADTQTSYDAVAGEYVRRVYGELAHKPFDRKILDWFIEKTRGSGTLCDMGCGPGQIGRYLYNHGATVCGIDLSPEMVAEARRLNPGIPFQQGNMLDLNAVADSEFSGIAAFHSVIHIPREQVVAALKELKRVLRQGGVLLLTVHIGTEVRHIEEFFEKKVSLDFVFFERDEMKRYVQEAGFLLEEVIERDPYPEGEAQTRRLYIFARKAS